MFHDVFSLQVPMNYFVPMKLRDAIDNLSYYLDSLAFGKFSLSQAIGI